MGFYGGNSTVLRELRRMSDRSYLERQEERDKLNKVNYKVDEILEGSIMIDVRVFRIVTGEEVVAELVSETSDTITVKNALVVLPRCSEC